jgi:hypothetical protein
MPDDEVKACAVELLRAIRRFFERLAFVFTKAAMNCAIVPVAIQKRPDGPSEPDGIFVGQTPAIELDAAGNQP